MAVDSDSTYMLVVAGQLRFTCCYYKETAVDCCLRVSNTLPIAYFMLSVGYGFGGSCWPKPILQWKICTKVKDGRYALNLNWLNI